MRIGRVAVVTVSASLLLSGCRWDSDTRHQDPANHPAYARPNAAPTAADHVARGPAIDQTEPRQAAFDLVNGADVVNVRVGDLGNTMFEVSTPGPAGSTPTVDVTGRSVVAGLRSSGNPGPTEVTVLLSAGLRWNVRLSGGANTETIDLSQAPGGDVDLTAGTSTADVTLPAAPGTQTVTMSGGASQVRVRLSGNAPARVTAAGGAGTVTIDDTTHTGVPGGSQFTPSVWATATTRYDINATAGVGTMTVTHNQPPPPRTPHRHPLTQTHS